MNKIRLKTAVLSLLYLIFGSANALAAVDVSALTIKVNGEQASSVKGCRNSLRACPGIGICPNCFSTPTSGSFTVSNNTNVTANGVLITTAIPINTYVTQSGSCGTGYFTLAAGSSCISTFTTTATTAPDVFTTNINITGTNVKPTSLPLYYSLNG